MNCGTASTCTCTCTSTKYSQLLGFNSRQLFVLWKFCYLVNVKATLDTTFGEDVHSTKQKSIHTNYTWMSWIVTQNSNRQSIGFIGKEIIARCVYYTNIRNTCTRLTACVAKKEKQCHCTCTKTTEAQSLQCITHDCNEIELEKWKKWKISPALPRFDATTSCTGRAEVLWC